MGDKVAPGGEVIGAELKLLDNTRPGLIERRFARFPFGVSNEVCKLDGVPALDGVSGGCRIGGLDTVT